MLYLEEDRPRTLSPARLEEDTREGAVLSPSQVTLRVPFPHPGLDPGAPGVSNTGRDHRVLRAHVGHCGQEQTHRTTER